MGLVNCTFRIDPEQIKTWNQTISRHSPLSSMLESWPKIPSLVTLSSEYSKCLLTISPVSAFAKQQQSCWNMWYHVFSKSEPLVASSLCKYLNLYSGFKTWHDPWPLPSPTIFLLHLQPSGCLDVLPSSQADFCCRALLFPLPGRFLPHMSVWPLPRIVPDTKKVCGEMCSMNGFRQASGQFPWNILFYQADFFWFFQST